jgi:hypothetical protein
MFCKSVIKLFVDNDDHLQCERGTILNKVPEEKGFQKCTQYIKVNCCCCFVVVSHKKLAQLVLIKYLSRTEYVYEKVACVLIK